MSERFYAMDAIARWVGCMKPRTAALLGLCLMLASCGLFPEASFYLLPESRLPKCFSLPAGSSREAVTVRLNYYSDGRAELILLDKEENKIKVVNGQMVYQAPLHLPAWMEHSAECEYELVALDGMRELIEHCEKAPSFHLSDDPAVWKALGLEEASQASTVRK